MSEIVDAYYHRKVVKELREWQQLANRRQTLLRKKNKQIREIKAELEMSRKIDAGVAGGGYGE